MVLRHRNKKGIEISPAITDWWYSFLIQNTYIFLHSFQEQLFLVSHQDKTYTSFLFSNVRISNKLELQSLFSPPFDIFLNQFFCSFWNRLIISYPDKCFSNRFKSILYIIRISRYTKNIFFSCSFFKVIKADIVLYCCPVITCAISWIA